MTEQAKSDHAQREYGEDRAADRKVAALARGARRAREKAKVSAANAKRIDRRHEAVMQLGAKTAPAHPCRPDRLRPAKSIPHR